MDFTEIVEEAMRRSNLKKSDVARATGYSYQYIHDLLSGKRRWHQDAINRVFNALNIKANFNIDSTDNPESEVE